jgi:hypothetical protein
MNFDVLKKVADGLNLINCTWAVGGSVMLNFHGLVEIPNDIDILIDTKDTIKIKKFMDSIGENINLPSKEPFRTKEFFGYNVDNTIIEFLGDFKIKLEDEKIYRFILDEKAIVSTVNIDNSKIPITSIEDWAVAYTVMKDPKKRVPLLKKYFDENGIQYRYLLERNLQQDIPEYIKEEIRNFEG